MPRALLDTIRSYGNLFHTTFAVSIAVSIAVSMSIAVSVSYIYCKLRLLIAEDTIQCTMEML
jgi:hypothetical protein